MTDWNTELAARKRLDEAITEYSRAFNGEDAGTVHSWALIIERSAIYPDDLEPLRFAHTSARSSGTSPATAAGLHQLGVRIAMNHAISGLADDQQ